MRQRAIIIGAGPAGLTAAYELLKRTDVLPIILEKSDEIGGISRTINYKGNRMDIGGHRFFSKSDRVMQWWMNIMPVQSLDEGEVSVSYHGSKTTVEAGRTTGSEKVMLVRRRLSRIYFLRKFFTYPIQLSIDTLRKLGFIRTISILLSYLWARVVPRRPEVSLEDFFINRFGKKLYGLFFKDYTEKVWGMSCTKIPAEWGAQRIKGISIAKAIGHAVKSLQAKSSKRVADIHQKGTETSLIENFLYPALGPGQLWEEVARKIEEDGGRIIRNQDVRRVICEEGKVQAIEAMDMGTGDLVLYRGDYFFSTMPVKELVAGMGSEVPEDVQAIASGLQYRDFVTVGVLLSKMTGDALQGARILPDTWIYVQERDVKVGRLQIFNNWSPALVRDPDTVWLGMEYFCNETDAFWQMGDDEIRELAIAELEKMGLAKAEDVLDTNVVRVEKTYPAYFGAYERFDQVRAFTDGFSNLFLVGRNGMHKYNNSDHSMLTAMVAVDNIVAGVTSKANIWAINTEQEYHEEKVSEKPVVRRRAFPVSELAPVGFKEYLLKDPVNRALLWIGVIGVILQLVIFKYLYPFAGFIDGDSYVYLANAMANNYVDVYPIGYSKILRIFSAFSTSDTAFISFQYLLIECSALFFLYSFFYFYRPGKWVRGILFVFIVFNPIFLFLSNYVSSDAIFLGLSIAWFAQLLWVMNRFSIRGVVIQALILFVAFTVRYNALYYPVIAAVAFLFVRRRVWVRLVGLLASVLLIGVFIYNTGMEYKRIIHIRQFSPFSGWQIANNALYGYRFVEHKDTVTMPVRFKEIDRMVRAYFDSTSDPRKYPEATMVASTYYMWVAGTPLQRYVSEKYAKKENMIAVQKFAGVAPLYSDYGYWLIRRYPDKYFRCYLLPNAISYYTPPTEFLSTYNMGVDSVREIAKKWFRYKSAKVTSVFQDYQVNILGVFPILFGTINIVLLASILGFIALGGLKKMPFYRNITILSGSLWAVNFGFSVFASPITLRFQLFPFLVFLSVGFLLIEQIYRMATLKKNQMLHSHKEVATMG